VAHLLGVVGTDVPEADLREAMSPHIVSEKCLYNINNIFYYLYLFIYTFQLGVNNYAFIVTNNGFIVTHPDLRPVVSKF